MKCTTLRCSIPPDMRATLEQDPFMTRCCVSGIDTLCSGRIEWNHAFTYAGRRCNEMWAILPMCSYHHQKEARFRRILKLIMRERAIQFKENIKDKYPRAVI
jgi:hypothetical protein